MNVSNSSNIENFTKKDINNNDNMIKDIENPNSNNMIKDIENPNSNSDIKSLNIKKNNNINEEEIKKEIFPFIISIFFCKPAIILFYSTIIVLLMYFKLDDYLLTWIFLFIMFFIFDYMNRMCELRNLMISIYTKSKDADVKFKSNLWGLLSFNKANINELSQLSKFNLWSIFINSIEFGSIIPHILHIFFFLIILNKKIKNLLLINIIDLPLESSGNELKDLSLGSGKNNIIINFQSNQVFTIISERFKKIFSCIDICLNKIDENNKYSLIIYCIICFLLIIIIKPSISII